MRFAVLRTRLRHEASAGVDAVQLHVQVVLLGRVQNVHPVEGRALLQAAAVVRTQQIQRHQTAAAAAESEEEMTQPTDIF
jgi:hypothetical protein